MYHKYTSRYSSSDFKPLITNTRQGVARTQFFPLYLTAYWYLFYSWAEICSLINSNISYEGFCEWRNVPYLCVYLTAGYNIKKNENNKPTIRRIVASTLRFQLVVMEVGLPQCWHIYTIMNSVTTTNPVIAYIHLHDKLKWHIAVEGKHIQCQYFRIFTPLLYYVLKSILKKGIFLHKGLWNAVARME